MSQRADATAAAPLNVANLPSYAFGHRSIMWWGTAGLMLIEGMVFAVTAISYFYLRSQVNVWPMSPPPELLWGTINTAVLLASAVPNHFTKRAAERHDLAKVRIGMVVCLVFSVVFLSLRVLEFTTLNCRWDSNAYGSVVWMLLGLHTVHLLTDAYDSAVLAVLMFTGPLEGKRFVDVSENALYWYFVVLSWLPIYGIVYWGARF
jgi:cytochrome c oxidase subunit III